MKPNLKNTIIFIIIVIILALIIKFIPGFVKKAEGQAKPLLQDTSWITTAPKDSLVLSFMIVGTKPVNQGIDTLKREDFIEIYDDKDVYEINWRELFQSIGALLGIASFLILMFFIRVTGVLHGKKD
jgi:hypothetical protein